MEFDRISDALSKRKNNDRFNLMGIVSEMGFPKQTKGTDCICTIKLVDFSSPTVGISVNIFQPQFEMLPLFKSADDIIVLWNVVVKKESSLHNLVLYKNTGSFAVYDGRDASCLSPYQASRLSPYKPSFSLSQASSMHTGSKKCFTMFLKYLREIREWILKKGIQSIKVSNISLIKEIKEGEACNLICKVLRVRCSNEGECMLYVWDGTDAPPPTVNSDLENECNRPLPLQFESSPLQTRVLRKFPYVGTVLRMTVEQSNGQLNVNLFKAGEWVQFRNIDFAVRSGLWYGILHAKSKFCLVPDDADYISQYQRNYDERLNQKEGQIPNSCIPWPSSSLTDTDTKHSDMPFTTLMNILFNREVTAKFKCVVRVVAINPGHPSYFRASDDTFKIRLTLEDPTARIHAYLQEEDAEKFFGGYPSINTMFRMLNALLGIDETDVEKPRNPPWVQCCIKSYAIDETRKYGIFDTKLEGFIG